MELIKPQCKLSSALPTHRVTQLSILDNDWCVDGLVLRSPRISFFLPRSFLLFRSLLDTRFPLSFSFFPIVLILFV